MRSEQEAIQAVEFVGYQAESAAYIPEGRRHDNFLITPPSGPLMIARFDKPDVAIDTQFNGPMSLIRERNLIDMVRDQAGLPAPRIYGLFESDTGPFLLVEHLPGDYWSEYLKNNNYSKEAFLRSLAFLGCDLGRAFNIKFSSFGDVLSSEEVHPGTVYNFAERVQMIIDLKVERAQRAQFLTASEFDETTSFFQTELTNLKEAPISPSQPGLVLPDLHPMNFFVDDNGKPSAYFDLELCQAGHPSLTFYDVRRNLFSYFRGVIEQAEEAFLRGYNENGEEYDPYDSINSRLQHVLGVGFLLGAATQYHGVVDGVRDLWSQQYRQIMRDAIQDGTVDYSAIGDVTRSKTRQPEYPN